jgi:hypothetical protein
MYRHTPAVETHREESQNSGINVVFFRNFFRKSPTCHHGANQLRLRHEETPEVGTNFKKWSLGMVYTRRSRSSQNARRPTSTLIVTDYADLLLEVEVVRACGPLVLPPGPAPALPQQQQQQHRPTFVCPCCVTTVVIIVHPNET